MSKDRLPDWIENYLKKWFDPFLLDGIYGDLLEQYHHDKANRSLWRARLRLIWSTLGLVRYRHLFKHHKITDSSPLITPDMIRNHLIVSLRNLFKNRGYTFINMVGLSLSFACCLLIGLYVQEELSYDRYHEKGDRIYRLACHMQGASFANGIAKVSAPWGPEAQATIPEVEKSCRFVFYGRTIVGRGEDRNYESGGLWVDSTVFDIFSWPLLYGNPKTALSAVNSVVINEELAERYFPGENPLGQSLTFDNTTEMTVTGVLKNVPDNSHFTFRYLVPLQGYTPPDQGDVWYSWNQYYTYLLLKDGVAPETAAAKIDNMLALHLDAERSENYTPILQPVKSIHLTSNLHREMSVNSDISYIYIFSIVALLLLIIATTNFINLFTARATHRTKEVGVRKVVGANRLSIVVQFIVESLLVTLFSGILAVGIAYWVLPSLNLILDRELVLDLIGNSTLTVSLIGMVIVTGILSGCYPALVLSSFKASSMLKTEAAGTFLRSFTRYGSRALFRKGLVVFQFGIATFLIVAALVVNGQLQYIQQKNLGFNKDQIIVIPMNAAGTVAKADLIKEELLKIPGVAHVSVSANRPGGSDYGVPYRAVGLAEDEQPSMRCLVVDEDFLETYGMEIAAGRGFSKAMSTDSTAYLINETAAAQLGWENPLNHMLSMPVVDREPAPIIGIVKDFHFHSLHEKIAPLYFFMEKTWFSQFSVKLDASRINETLEILEEKWTEFEPNHPFQYAFFDEGFATLHAAEASTARLIRWFTFLAIFITCLGLFGLSAYTSERRTKEIGIRKVFGASVKDILSILVKEVLTLVLLAVLLAVPIAWMVGSDWLENYAYTFNFGFAYLLLAALLAVSIAVLAVSYHVLRSAIRNPIKALRYE